MEAIGNFFSSLGKMSIPLIACILPAALSIILLCILLAAKSKEKKYKRLLKSKSDYCEVFSEGGTQVSVILEHKKFIPLFCSKNADEILSIDRERLMNDFIHIKSMMSRKDFRTFMAEYEKWDGEEPLDFDFQNEINKKHFRLTLCECCNKKYDYIIICDNSKYKEKGRELRSAIKKAQDESERKTAFLSNVSHDIRTPMNGIIGMLLLAQNQLDENSQVYQYISKAKDLSDFLLNIINDILDISRIEAGKFELNPEEFNLDELIDDLESLNRKSLENKGLKFTVERKDCNIKSLIGDELKIKQIISNLLSNSYKFTQSGEVKLSFREMSATDGKVELMIGVSDTGEGMSNDFIKRVFQPFEREDRNNDNKIVGSGLGMAIADKFTHLMGGEIFVESQKGKGSHFSICLPLKSGSEKITAQKQTLPPADSFTFDGLKILMAEDNEINLEIGKSIFEMEGASVTPATNGKEALNIFTQSEPYNFDLILMDIQMPVMNGWQAIEAIRESGKADAEDIPIFTLTADAYVNNSGKAAKEKVNSCFLKPIEPDKIKSEIATAVAQRKDRK